MASTIYVTLSPSEAAGIAERAITQGSITGEMIDSYDIGNNESRCIVMVFEKYYNRAGNRLTLTVVVDGMDGRTRVHLVGGGGGEGLFRFDWGASESFENTVLDALDSYTV